MMLDHLRHKLFPLSAGLLLFSCSSEEPSVSGYEMKFDISGVSRSAVTTAANITEKPFAIFGDMVPSGLTDNPSARTVLYDNTPVTYLNSAWTVPSHQYWYHNHEHSFVAIHPASVLSMTDAGSKYINSQHSFTYTLPLEQTNVSDILVATHRRVYTDQREYDKAGNVTGGAADVVYLQFGHILSRINLAPAFADNVMNEEGFINFHKVEFSGFKTKVTYKITPASLLSSSQTDDREVITSDHEGNGNLIIEFPDPITVKNDNKNVRLFDDDDSIIMLPQEFTAEQDAKIILSYTINNETSIKQIALLLNGQEWISGKSYNYKFTIDRTGLVFGSTTITDWNVLDVGNIDVQ